METMVPHPAGLEAPDRLPAAPAAVSAEATGLGGTYAVTLIATATQEPVNAPQLGAAAGNPATDLGTYSTTPTATAATAAAFLATASTQDIAGCTGPGTPAPIGAAGASSCQTDQGPAITWDVGSWRAQVQSVEGTRAPVQQATALASWLAHNSLPPSASGVIAVAVPGSAQDGTATTSTVLWDYGSDVYQVTTRDSVLDALGIASTMRPWPGS